jgi:hypothetical protein
LSKFWEFITIVVGVFAVAAFIGWRTYRLGMSMDRAQQDPKYMRRVLYRGAALYGFGLVFGVTQVISGDLPPASLLAAPISLLLIWFYLRTAKRVKIPPE